MEASVSSMQSMYSVEPESQNSVFMVKRDMFPGLITPVILGHRRVKYRARQGSNEIHCISFDFC